jgi:DedD protein
MNQKSGGLTLQVGSYSDIGQADARVESLKAAGFEGRVVSVEIPKRGTWYRVQVGRFADRAEAARFGEQMRGKGAAESVIVTEAQK